MWPCAARVLRDRVNKTETSRSPPSSRAKGSREKSPGLPEASPITWGEAGKSAQRQQQDVDSVIGAWGSSEGLDVGCQEGIRSQASLRGPGFGSCGDSETVLSHFSHN